MPVNLPPKPIGDPGGMQALAQQLLAWADDARSHTYRASAARDLGMQGPAGDADLAILEDVCRQANALATRLEDAARTLGMAVSQLEADLAQWQRTVQNSVSAAASNIP